MSLLTVVADVGVVAHPQGIGGNYSAGSVATITDRSNRRAKNAESSGNDGDGRLHLDRVGGLFGNRCGGSAVMFVVWLAECF